MPIQRVRAYAPGSIGNVGPGLDILGLAVAGAGDAVTASQRDGRGIVIADPGHPDLPSDPGRHAAGIAARAVLARAGVPNYGVTLTVEKGLPLSGGQGGSAASAAAGAGAVNALIGSPLGTTDLVAAAMEAEAVVAGRHADNVAPSVLGGLVLVRSLDPLDLVRLPIPPGLVIVLVRPRMTLSTAEARAALPRDIPTATALHQAAQVAALVAGAVTGDLRLLGRAIDDRIAEPARAPLLPGFVEARRAALEAGSLGASISGSGPTAFAFTDDPDRARSIASAMQQAYQRHGLASDARITGPDLEGLRVTAL
jgi:homoserine kinase